jgi:hypothetical protein
MLFKYKPRYFKSLIVLLCCLFFSFSVNAQYVTIPDTAFVNWLSANGFDSCLVGSQLDTTCSAVLDSTYIDCSNANIQDLTGIQYFKSVVTLICDTNLLDSLPALPTLLTYLDFSFNAVSPNSVLPNSITYLNCSQNELTVLPVLPASLLQLDCSYNMLTSLPVLPVTLNMLACEGNYLDSLAPPQPPLTWIDCSDNRIFDLPVLPDSLYWFYCGTNPLLCLPWLNTIVNLDFSNTSVSCIPDSGNVTNSNPPLGNLPLCSVSDPSGCSTYTSLAAIENYDITLYPNPASDYTVLSLDKEISNTRVQLLDATGRVVQSTEVVNLSCRIPVGSLQQGLYFVRVVNPTGGGLVKKLVVE